MDGHHSSVKEEQAGCKEATVIIYKSNVIVEHLIEISESSTADSSSSKEERTLTGDFEQDSILDKTCDNSEATSKFDTDSIMPVDDETTLEFDSGSATEDEAIGHMKISDHKGFPCEESGKCPRGDGEYISAHEMRDSENNSVLDETMAKLVDNTECPLPLDKEKALANEENENFVSIDQSKVENNENRNGVEYCDEMPSKDAAAGPNILDKSLTDSATSDNLDVEKVVTPFNSPTNKKAQAVHWNLNEGTTKTEVSGIDDKLKEGAIEVSEADAKLNVIEENGQVVNKSSENEEEQIETPKMVRQGTFDLKEAPKKESLKEKERKAGNLIFQSSIQEFSKVPSVGNYQRSNSCQCQTTGYPPHSVGDHDKLSSSYHGEDVDSYCYGDAPVDPLRETSSQSSLSYFINLENNIRSRTISEGLESQTDTTTSEQSGEELNKMSKSCGQEYTDISVEDFRGIDFHVSSGHLEGEMKQICLDAEERLVRSCEFATSRRIMGLPVDPVSSEEEEDEDTEEAVMPEEPPAGIKASESVPIISGGLRTCDFPSPDAKPNPLDEKPVGTNFFIDLHTLPPPESKDKNKNVESKGDGEERKSGIFSMFIDINDPDNNNLKCSNGDTLSDRKNKNQQNDIVENDTKEDPGSVSGGDTDKESKDKQGVYMFIEMNDASSTPSKKPKHPGCAKTRKGTTISPIMSPKSHKSEHEGVKSAPPSFYYELVWEEKAPKSGDMPKHKERHMKPKLKDVTTKQEKENGKGSAQTTSTDSLQSDTNQTVEHNANGNKEGSKNDRDGNQTESLSTSEFSEDTKESSEAVVAKETLKEDIKNMAKDLNETSKRTSKEVSEETGRMKTITVTPMSTLDRKRDDSRKKAARRSTLEKHRKPDTLTDKYRKKDRVATERLSKSATSSHQERRGSGYKDKHQYSRKEEEHLLYNASLPHYEPKRKDSSPEISLPIYRKGRNSEELLAMYEEGIDTDVVVEAAGERALCHKMVLVSRSCYFAAQFAGFPESRERILKITGYSFDTVEFCLRHIYCGTTEIPEQLNIAELATLADLLELDGLKEMISYTLTTKYCHFFHKPCSGCTVGVVECLRLATSVRLETLSQRCVRWIAKHFTTVWPTKHFAFLPTDLLIKCRRHVSSTLSGENVLDTLLGCSKILGTLPHVKWSGKVFDLTTQLGEDTVRFMSDHFSDMLTSKRFVTLGCGMSWSVNTLDESILEAVTRMPVMDACSSYSAIHKLVLLSEAADCQWTQNFTELLKRLYETIEKFVVSNASQVVRCAEWEKLDTQLQANVRAKAVVVDVSNNSSKIPVRKLPVRNSDRSVVRRPSTSRTGQLQSATSSSRTHSGKSSITPKTPQKLDLQVTPRTQDSQRNRDKEPSRAVTLRRGRNSSDSKEGSLERSAHTSRERHHPKSWPNKRSSQDIGMKIKAMSQMKPEELESLPTAPSMVNHVPGHRTSRSDGAVPTSRLPIRSSGNPKTDAKRLSLCHQRKSTGKLYTTSGKERASSLEASLTNRSGTFSKDL